MEERRMLYLEPNKEMGYSNTGWWENTEKFQGNSNTSQKIEAQQDKLGPDDKWLRDLDFILWYLGANDALYLWLWLK